MESIGNLIDNVKGVPVSFFSRIFNISPSQWPRVTECWFITLFFKIGSAIGWTVLTASFVGQFGIAWLPALFVINATGIIVSTFFFEKLIMRVKREILMILMLIAAGTSLFLASFMYERSVMGFFGLVIFAESMFLAQFYVFLPILVGDRFTPLESQNTFPFIESAESIGGILGGTLVGVLAFTLPITAFLYIWMVCLICIIFAFIITSSVRMGLPPMPFRVSSSMNREKPMDQMKLVMQSIKKIPFVKGLIIIVLVQWVFMNLLEFQFTKAVEQAVTTRHEPTIAREIDAFHLKAAVLNSSGGDMVVPPSPGTAVYERALDSQQQVSMTKKLGQLKGMFSAATLLVQIIFASRLITSLGVVGSMLLHPIIMLLSLLGMFFKFGFFSSAITKLNFEVTNVVHKNAYFASQYAMPKTIRDQAAEFLEGIVRPMGTIVSMLLILGFQFVFANRDLTAVIHVLMFISMGIILVVTVKLKPRYTNVTKAQLFATDLPYTEQVNAIEILEQKGHEGASRAFVQKLMAIAKNPSAESDVVRIRLIAALGQSRDYSALPEILDALKDSDPDIRLEAAHALMNFHDIGEQFYSQAFSRFRMVELLKDIFRNEPNPAVRNAVIRVFSLLREPAIVAFLIDVLRTSPPDVQADCIYTLGLFHDPNAAYYILPFVQSPHAEVRSNAVVALWQFHKYHDILEEQLHGMLNGVNRDEVCAGLFALGEIGLNWHHLFADCLSSEDSTIRWEAALALLKCGDPRGFSEMIAQLLSAAPLKFNQLRHMIARLKTKSCQLFERLLAHYIPNHLHLLTERYEGKSLEEMDAGVLEQLRRLYMLLGQHEELFEIEKAIQSVSKPSLI